MCCSTTLASFRNTKMSYKIDIMRILCTHGEKSTEFVYKYIHSTDLGGGGKWIPCNYVCNQYDRLHFPQL